MAAPVLVDADTQTASNGPGADDVTVNAPSNLADDDVCILVLGHDNATVSVTWPSGFTEIQTAALSGSSLAAAYKVITDASSEPASYTITDANGSGFTAISARITGADTSSALGQTGAALTGNGSSQEVTGVTTTEDEELIVGASTFDGADGIGGANGDTNHLWDESGWTRADQVGIGGGGNGISTSLASGEQATAGATGDITVTFAANDGSASFLFSIKPDPGGSSLALPQGIHGIGRGFTPQRSARLGGMLEAA